ncbi:PREDICTED: uncharacterized protein LOC104811274 [Tarenaya hassleriana]|uniref:uncharacterized protein LOC104811274 n=1 Tax=Tarenaya hassleriana TaxID=28532 RepID=UPI00053CA45C|nr:PREDICTED: uncharacterized protein LOC104811274 [Tarenaya hassleriana]
MHRYMQQGAEAIHSVNPDVLVIMSGLVFDTDLSFVENRPVNISFAGKLVFELHWFSSSRGIFWAESNANDVCGDFFGEVKSLASFLLDKGFPLFVSEFGIDETTDRVKEDRYIDCLLGWLSENDVDWSIWTLAGSYYLREGSPGADEPFGVLSRDWIYARNPILERLPFVQSALRGPGSQTENRALLDAKPTGRSTALIRELPISN